MTYPQAIVAAAALIAGSILFTNLAQTQTNQTLVDAGGRFRIAATPGQTVANAWRLDTRTGEVYRCFATGGMFGALCRRARFMEMENANPDAPELPDPDSVRFTGARARTYQTH